MSGKALPVSRQVLPVAATEKINIIKSIIYALPELAVVFGTESAGSKGSPVESGA